MKRKQERKPKNYHEMTAGERIVWDVLGKKRGKITRHDRLLLAVRIDSTIVLGRDEQRNNDVQILQGALNTIISDYD